MGRALVIIDQPVNRAMQTCKPYSCRLTLEACAKRHIFANLPESTERVTACRNCLIGVSNKYVLRKHGISVKLPANKVPY